MGIGYSCKIVHSYNGRIIERWLFMKYLYILLAIISFMVLLFISNIIIQICIEKRMGKRLPKKGRADKVRPFIIRVLVDFPRQIIKDIFALSDYEFTMSGLHLIVGEQGSGKTIALVYLLRKYKQIFPMCNIRTNMGYKYQEGDIKSWGDLVFKNNGIHGQIDVIDEIQNWFNSLQSKDFPPEMFGEITQQRKQRKCIFGTSQVWQRVAKPIREQVSLVYKPTTLLGCMTIVRVYKPSVDDDGSIENLKLRKMFFFIHNKDIRESFDTYHKIQVQALKGYKNINERIGKEIAPVGSAVGQ